MNSTVKYDVVIIGAGMVGASLIHLLKHSIQLGLKVALVERFELQTDVVDSAPPSFDGRATALSFGTQRILSQLNVWPDIQQVACAIHNIQVTDKGHFGQAHIKNSDADVDALGYVIRNQFLGQGLLKNFPDSVAIYAPQQVEKVEITAEVKAAENNEAEDNETEGGQAGALLRLDSGDILETKLLVMADGGRSDLANDLGIQVKRKSYHSHALVTSVKIDRSHDHWAYERFTQSGPLAMLPLAENEFAVVWTLPEDSIEEYLDCSDAEFIQQLQKHFGYRAGLITELGDRASYPLALAQAQEQIRPHLVLLGNAAHGLHPVAGQGFNLALRDTVALAEQINLCFQQNDIDNPMGGWPMLQAYLEHQLTDQKNTILASDVLPRLFSLENKATQIGRGMGLLSMATNPVARKLFARHAMGLGQKAASIRSVQTNAALTSTVQK